MPIIVLNGVHVHTRSDHSFLLGVKLSPLCQCDAFPPSLAAGYFSADRKHGRKEEKVTHIER